MPLRSRRCFIHAGRRRARIDAFDDARHEARAGNRRRRRAPRARRGSSTGACGDGAAATSGAPVTAATSRAMPSTDRQSARFGVILSVISVSSSCEHVADVRTHASVRRQLEQARGIGVDAELARGAQHSLRFDAAHRRRGDAKAAGKLRADGCARRLHAGGGVGRAADDAQALGRADVDRAHAQAIGVRMRIDLVDPARRRRRRRAGRPARTTRLRARPSSAVRTSPRCRAADRPSCAASVRRISSESSAPARPPEGRWRLLGGSERSERGGRHANWRRKRRSFSKNRRRSLTP